jgi:hypothetical protein
MSNIATSQFDLHVQALYETQQQFPNTYRCDVGKFFINAWEWVSRRFADIPQCTLTEGIPAVGNTAYRKVVRRRSNQPYMFRYRHPSMTITAIACVPLDEKTQTPEADVLKGGINDNFAVICLTPVQEGDWGCLVSICTETPKGAE